MESGGLNAPVGNWEFVEGAQNYMGEIDSAYIISGGITKELHLTGKAHLSNQAFNIVLYTNDDSFVNGPYKASLFQSTFNYSIPGKSIYQANQLLGEFIVNITSLTTGFINGTFSGKAIDSTNKMKDITLGKFKATIGDGLPTPISIGVLGSNSGNCEPVTLNGVYAPGIPSSENNTVQIKVTVATEGTYNISTNSVNGISFSNSGTFNTQELKT